MKINDKKMFFNHGVADPYFMGSLDDFRIYDRALSEGEIRYLAGDR